MKEWNQDVILPISVADYIRTLSEDPEFLETFTREHGHTQLVDFGWIGVGDQETCKPLTVSDTVVEPAFEEAVPSLSTNSLNQSNVAEQNASGKIDEDAVVQGMKNVAICGDTLSDAPTATATTATQGSSEASESALAAATERPTRKSASKVFGDDMLVNKADSDAERAYDQLRALVPALSPDMPKLKDFLVSPSIYAGINPSGKSERAEAVMAGRAH
jgi:hypothetical protein